MDWWAKFTEVVLNAVQAVAIVVGGGWVYFKFIRSRTFARRAELDIEAALVSVEGLHVLRVKVVMKNTGLSKISLKDRTQVAALWGTPASAFSPGANFEWQRLMMTDVLKAHRFVEAQEAIKDEALLPADMQGGPWLAFRIEVQVVAEPRWRITQAIRWVTGTIIPAQIDQPVQAGDF